MTRILYGLCSVGIGHAVRSKLILEHLFKKHDVLIVASGKAYNYLEKFFPKNILNIEGFELVFNDNSIESFGTVLVNLKKVSGKTLDNINKCKEKMNRFNPDVVVSDWEPFTSFYAKNKNLPLISIDNQHYLVFGDLHFPKRYWFQYMKARAVLQSLMRKSDYYIISLFPGNKLKHKNNIYAVPPIIRKDVLGKRAYKKDYVLVYQSTKSYDRLVDILKSVNQKFIIYGFDKNKKQGNITFKKFNTGYGFTRDLANAKAVIANGGFTLISEALYLRKPLLVIPIRKHFEQIINACYIQENKYGEFYEDLDEKSLSHFLMNLENFKIPRRKADNKKVLKLIDKIIERDVNL